MDFLKRKKSPKSESLSYKTVFLNDRKIRTRQPVYISRELHQQITRIVHLLALSGNNVSIGGFIDNVLLNHIEQYKNEISELRKQANDNLIL